MDSRRYIANQSSRMIQGDANAYTDHSSDINVTIGQSFNERRAQIDDLVRLVSALKDIGPDNADKVEIQRDLESVKDELEEQRTPDSSRVRTWLERAKTGIEALKLGTEMLRLANKVFESFGLPTLPAL